MGMMSTNLKLINLYVDTKDEKYIREIMENNTKLISNAIRNTLEKYDMDLSKEEEYFSLAYIHLYEKLKRITKKQDKETNFYYGCLITLRKILNKEMKKERIIFENTISLSEVSDTVIDYSVLETIDEMCTEGKNKIINSIIEKMPNERQRYLLRRYFDFDGKGKTNFDEMSNA